MAVQPALAGVPLGVAVETRATPRRVATGEPFASWIVYLEKAAGGLNSVTSIGKLLNFGTNTKGNASRLPTPVALFAGNYFFFIAGNYFFFVEIFTWLWDFRGRQSIGCVTIRDGIKQRTVPNCLGS
jgi:hypothetical protein